MIKLDQDTKKRLRYFSENIFRDKMFIRMLLSGLYQQGIHVINENDLSKKLFYYYQNPDYQELFQDIVKDKSEKKVDIYEAMSYEKHMSGYIWWSSMEFNKLHLNYNFENYDNAMSGYNRYLSENGRRKMKQMIEELAVTIRLEKKLPYSLQIYHIDPNQSYHLICGIQDHVGLLNSVLITDGKLKSTKEEKNSNSNILYPNPIEDSYVKLTNCIADTFELKDAGYAAIQGLKNGSLKRLQIYTELATFSELNRINEITSQCYSADIKGDGPVLVKIHKI